MKNNSSKNLKDRLTDFDYLQSRLADSAASITELIREYEELLPRLNGADRAEVEGWATFLRERAHLLRRGNKEWPANRILLQLAVEHADDSPISSAAEEWLRAGHCDWFWLRQAARRESAVLSACVRVYEGHSQPVIGAMMLSDNRLLSWSRDHTLRIWQLNTGETISVLTGHIGSWLNTISLSDNRLLTYSSDYFAQDKTPADPILRIWDQTTGQLQQTLTGHSDSVTGAVQLEDGRILSWSKDQTLRIWDVRSGKTLITFDAHPDKIEEALATRDGRIISRSEDKTVHIWDAYTGNSIRTIKLYRHTDFFIKMLLLPNGHMLTLSTEDWDRQFCLWNIDTGELIAANTAGWVMGGLPLTDDRVVTWEAYGKELSIWDCHSGQLLQKLVGHTKCANGALMLPNNRLLSWSDDMTLRLWDLDSGETLVTMSGHQDTIEGAKLLPDNRVLSWARDNTLRLWNYHNGQLLATLTGHTRHINGVMILKDHQIISSGNDNSLRLWDLNLDRPTPTGKAHQNRVIGTALLSDNQLLTWSDSSDSLHNSALCLWDIESGRLVKTYTDRLNRISGAMELKDRRLLSWSHDAVLRIWHRDSGELLLTLDIPESHDNNVDADDYLESRYCVRSVLEIGENRLLCWYYDDHNLRLWNTNTGELIAKMAGQGGKITSVQLLAENRVLTSGGDGTLRLWDGITGQLLKVIDAHDHVVSGTLVLNDRELISWSGDYTLKRWDLVTGECLQVFAGHNNGIHRVRLLPDNRLISWAGQDAIHIWELSADRPVFSFKLDNSCVNNAMFLPGDRLLTAPCWRCKGDCRVWSWQTGECLESFPEDELWQRYPDYLPEWKISGGRHAEKANDGFVSIGGGNHVECYVPRSGNQMLASWQADAVAASVWHVLDDGTVIVTLESGEVCYLKLYHGNQRIDLSIATQRAAHLS